MIVGHTFGHLDLLLLQEKGALCANDIAESRLRFHDSSWPTCPAVLVRKDWEIAYYKSEELFCLCVVVVNGNRLCCVSVHLPDPTKCRDKHISFDEVLDKIDDHMRIVWTKLGWTHCLFGGDLNVDLGLNGVPSSGAWGPRHEKVMSFIDCWHLKFEGPWQSYSHLHKCSDAWRTIDYVFTSAVTGHKSIHCCDFVPEWSIRSDHYPIVGDICIAASRKSPARARPGSVAGAFSHACVRNRVAALAESIDFNQLDDISSLSQAIVKCSQVAACDAPRASHTSLHEHCRSD